MIDPTPSELPRPPAPTTGSSIFTPRFFRICTLGLIVVGSPVFGVFLLWYGCLFGSIGLTFLRQLVAPRNTPLPALHIAVASGDLLAIKSRLQSGDPVDLRAFGNSMWDDGTTPLIIAVTQDDVESTQLLLDHGASLDISNINGDRAVHLASARTMALLLQRGADINARTRHGQTPLMRAAIRARVTKDLSVVQLLLNSGADVNARDNQGYTAISVLRTWPDPDPSAIKMIEKAGGK
jgi:Ankyrin repeats (3 copies)/Ankyrin repeat